MRRLGRVEEALSAFRFAIALKPDFAAASHNLSGTLNAKDFGPQWQDYQVDVESFRASRYLDYPRTVQIETLATCNAACTFCPYVTLERAGTRMPMTLIEKIIPDLEEVPRDLAFTIEPVKVSEPFLDKRLFDTLALCNQRLPRAALKLTSNASPITERVLDRLAEVRNLRRLFISFNDHRPEPYQRTMKLPYARTLDRLDGIHRRKADGRLDCRVIVSRVGDGSAVDQDFAAWVRDHYPAFETMVYSRFDWTGQVDVTAVGAVPPVACQRWFDLSITATGVVALCCTDGHAAHAIGDVSRDHTLAVYNAPSYRALRERARTSAGIDPCDRCTYS